MSLICQPASKDIHEALHHYHCIVSFCLKSSDAKEHIRDNAHRYQTQVCTDPDNVKFYHLWVFVSFLSENINDAVSFNLVNQNEDLKRQILARQDRVTSSPLIHKCAVVVGGCTEDDAILDELSAFRVEPGRHFGTYPLKPFPESCGIHFASCVWKNELYVSGGSKKRHLFCQVQTRLQRLGSTPRYDTGIREARHGCRQR